MYKIIIYQCKIVISTYLSYNGYNISQQRVYRLKNDCPFNANDNRKSFLLEFAYYSIKAQDLLHVFKMHVTLIPNKRKPFVLYFAYSKEAQNLSHVFT